MSARPRIECTPQLTSTSKGNSPEAGCEISSFARYRRDCTPRKRLGDHSSGDASRPFSQMARFERTCFRLCQVIEVGEGVPYNDVPGGERHAESQAGTQLQEW